MFAAGAIDEARRRTSDTRVRFALLEALHERESFDLCYVNGAYHHMAQANRTATRRIHELLRPGGTLALFETNPDSPRSLGDASHTVRIARGDAVAPSGEAPAAQRRLRRHEDELPVRLPSAPAKAPRRRTIASSRPGGHPIHGRRSAAVAGTIHANFSELAPQTRQIGLPGTPAHGSAGRSDQGRRGSSRAGAAQSRLRADFGDLSCTSDGQDPAGRGSRSSLSGALAAPASAFQGETGFRTSDPHVLC